MENDTREKEMYAFFNVMKLNKINNINTDQLIMERLDYEQSSLQDGEIANNMGLSAEKMRSAQVLETLYRKLADPTLSEGQRKAIEAEIDAEQQKSEAKKQEFELKNQQLGMEENAIELQKKKLESVVTKLEKELDTIEEAEKTGIERANPKYNGLG